MKTSKNGIDLIKQFESLRLEPYYCSAGVLTIGYGHTRTVHPNMEITKEQAEDLLKSDLEIFEKCVIDLDQNKFDALVSFAFNLGCGSLKTSTLYGMVKENPNNLYIAGEFVKWIKAGGKPLRGLLKRRLAEAQLYFK